MRAFSILTVLAAALVASAAASAAPPSPQPLNPPVPSYYSCKTVGDGTICDGQPPLESWRNVDTADEGTPIVCGSGAAAFHVLDSGDDQVTAHRVYDGNGDLVRRVLRDDYSFGAFSNAVTGASVLYSQSDIRTDVLAVPGDLGTATETTTWNSHYGAPGAGAPVFVNTGRTVQAPDGTFTARSGRLGFFDLFLDGDTSVLDPLCAALGA